VLHYGWVQMLGRFLVYLGERDGRYEAAFASTGRLTCVGVSALVARAVDARFTPSV
jgi:hypothetical protein